MSYDIDFSLALFLFTYFIDASRFILIAILVFIYLFIYLSIYSFIHLFILFY